MGSMRGADLHRCAIGRTSVLVFAAISHTTRLVQIASNMFEPGGRWLYCDNQLRV
jgi:hypothetical protein